MACIALTAVSAGTAVVRAHEIGTTRVVATFAPDHRFAVEITTDAAVLLARLERARQQPRSDPASAGELQRRLDVLCNDIPRHVSLVFDTVGVSPVATCAVEPPSQGDELSSLGVVVTLRGAMPADARTFRWRYDLTFASYALTVNDGSGEAATVWLEGSEQSRAMDVKALAAPASTANVTRQYFELGFTHILPKGLDHILFVLGIFLFSRRVRPMLWQVSAFTLAHSMTLGLTLLGVISVPSSVVEPLIALSIVYVAAENLALSTLKPWRVAFVFAFGLLHGMGFAGVLQEIGLPRADFINALVAFNVGVEAGQLAVLLIAFVLVGSLSRNHERYRRLVVVPASAVIALTGAYWTVQRLAGL